MYKKKFLKYFYSLWNILFSNFSKMKSQKRFSYSLTSIRIEKGIRKPIQGVNIRKRRIVTLKLSAHKGSASAQGAVRQVKEMIRGSTKLFVFPRIGSCYCHFSSLPLDSVRLSTNAQIGLGIVVSIHTFSTKSKLIQSFTKRWLTVNTSGFSNILLDWYAKNV